MTGNPFTIKPYVGYLVFMNLPALIFMSSVTFFLGAVLRRQAAVALIVIGYLLAVLLFLGRRYDGIYDFGAFFAPLYYSRPDWLGRYDASGLATPVLYLARHWIFGFSIDWYPRLAHSLIARWFGRGCALTGFGLAVGLYFFMDAEAQDAKAYRSSLLSQQEAVANIPVAEITHYDLALTLLGEAPLAASGTISLRNPHESPLDTLILSLNPGFEIQSLTHADGGAIAWDRMESVIRVMPDYPLQSDPEARFDVGILGRYEHGWLDLQREKARPKLRKRDRIFNKER